MLPEAKMNQLKEFISTSTKDELLWINGFLNGIVSGNSFDTAAAVSSKNTVKKITLLYGTETGNAKSLATKFAGIAKKKGLAVKLSALDQYRLTDLEKEEQLFIVVSTQGEGEPPETARKFYEHIHSQTFALGKTNFAVLALGDSSYPLFCKTGEDIDLQLEKFGAKRVLPLVKCDVDYEEDGARWFEQVLDYVSRSTDVSVTDDWKGNAIGASEGLKKATKKIYTGTVVANVNLNDKGSLKETYHVEIAADTIIDYEAGDALAIIPENKQFIVDAILALTGIDPSVEIQTSKHSGNVREILTRHLNVCYLLGSVIKKYAEIVGLDIPDTRVDLIDLLKSYPVRDAQQFEEIIKILTPIAPRLYTISSSPKVHEQEVHITVRRDEFISLNGKQFGLCSQFFGEAALHTTIQFYIHKNKHFKLAQEDKNLIMIGPGTGIAPFRSFLAERDATGATGKNWLFFGEHYFQKDFLYQTELQSYLQTDVLQEISLAFSRDQKEKIYVQHKIAEQGEKFYDWVNNGAYIYLSGSKDPMSNDVEIAILQVFEKFGGKTTEAAKAYLEQMKKDGRYQKEVY